MIYRKCPNMKGCKSHIVFQVHETVVQQSCRGDQNLHGFTTCDSSSLDLRGSSFVLLPPRNLMKWARGEVVGETNRVT